MRTEEVLQPGDLVQSAGAARRVGDAVLRLFDDLGFDIADFMVEDEPHSALARELGLLGGLLRVQCRSTNEDRLYSSGRGSTWMASILGDLDDGHFARALRRNGVHPSSRRADVRQAQQHALNAFSDTVPDVRLASAHDVGPRSAWGQVVPLRPRSDAMRAAFGGF